MNLPLPQATETFLIKNNEVLLGMKKKGFGKGYLIGIGGKKTDNETIEETAIREVKEETGAIVLKIKKMAIVNFYFPYIKDHSWDQQVHAFIVTSWKGKIHETEEIKPQWFDKNHLPFDLMWDDSRYWLPQVLDGKIVKADFFFDKNNSRVDDYSFRFEL